MRKLTECVKDSSLVINNVSYKEDVYYSVQINRWLMMCMGAWPHEFLHSLKDIILANLIVFVYFILILGFLILCGLNCVLQEKSDQEQFLNICAVILFSFVLPKYLNLLINGHNIYKCIHLMEIDWQLVSGYENREIMLTSSKFNRYIIICVTVGMQFFSLSYGIIFARTSVVYSGNETLIIKTLPLPVYQLIDTRFSPVYDITLWLELITIYFVTSITASSCNLAFLLCSHAYAQTKILHLKIKKWIDRLEKKSNSTHDKLVDIVQCHLRILRFIANIEKVMNMTCLVEIVASSIVICLSEYGSIKFWNGEGKGIFSSSIFVLSAASFTCNIFIYCFMGEVLTEQCRKVGELAYFTDWYRLQPKNAVNLILIISRANVTIQITAGKMVNLSIATFGAIMKTSLVYLNMLLTLSAF